MVLKFFYDALDFACLVVKIRFGVKPDMDSYWSRRGYHDYMYNDYRF